MNPSLPPWFQSFPHTIPNMNPLAMGGITVPPNYQSPGIDHPIIGDPIEDNTEAVNQTIGGAAGVVGGVISLVLSGGASAPIAVPVIIAGCYESSAGFAQVIDPSADLPDTYLGALASPLGEEASEFADCVEKALLADPDSALDALNLGIEMQDLGGIESKKGS